ncbi:translation initiation factor IF-2 [Candidatus Roizmanbacteria bacterium]|nr:translation initiation factor IF-2 [Candidatus Roizmanbacteria bacterium]
MSHTNPRPPIVAILGHVDHGKTSLLDFIRSSHITAKEHGGITQKIGAYEITTTHTAYATPKITFIDTPGHEAFSQLRARGATIADIAILIIDAKDSLKPQTIESIYHIKNANIPYIVALNKVDLPEANPNKVKNDLLKHEVIVEDKGGDVPVVEISAKTGKGVENLLETLLLIIEDKHLVYDLDNPPQAYIIETKKDRRGIVASAIIKDGVLRIGDTVYSEAKKCKVRTLINDLGATVREVTPSTPFEVLGFEEMPEVGTLITKAQVGEKLVETLPSRPTDIRSMLQEKPEEKKLALVVKADSVGSMEAIIQSLSKNEDVKIILNAVGDVHRSDIFLAKTTKAIVIGFSVTIDNEVKELAKQEKVIIKTYNIIYELLDELYEVSQLLKEKEEKEKSLKGEAKILATFIIEGEKIFGIKVLKGKINLGDPIELHRDNNPIGKTKVVSLKNRAKPVQEVKKEQEAGVVLSPPLDIKIGDMIKSIL